MHLVWLHGLEGSPFGYKATQLRRRGWDLLAPDGRGKPLAQRVDEATAFLDRLEGEIVLAGSSYGGLAAAAIASTGRPLAGLLLLAPALHHSEPPVDDAATLEIPATTPTIVLHGTGDAIVPIAASRALAARCPHVSLRELDDGHALADSLDAIDAGLSELTGAVAVFGDLTARRHGDRIVLHTPEGPIDLQEAELDCVTNNLIGGVGTRPIQLTVRHADGSEQLLVDFEVDDDQAADEAMAITFAIEGFVERIQAHSPSGTSAQKAPRRSPTA